MIFSVKARNFRSYKGVAYTVEGPGLVAVEGAWDNSQERSNGAGKTTLIPDLLCWALYGETIGGETRVCQEGATSRCEVELELPFVSLVRSQATDGTKNKLKIKGVEHRRLADAEAYLACLVPPKKIFASTIVLGQGVGERFTGWKPAERAKVFTELLALSVWPTARQQLAGDLGYYVDQQAQCLAVADALTKQSEVMMASTAGGDIDVEAARAELTKLQSSVEYDTEQAVEFRAELVNKQATLAAQQQKLAQLQSELSQVNQHLKVMSSGKCPTCGQKWPKQTVQSQRSDLNKRKDVLDVEVVKFEKSMIKSGSLQCTKNHLDYHMKKLSESTPRVQELRELLARAEGVEEQAVAILGRAEDARKQAAAAEAEAGLLRTLDLAFHEIPLRKIDGVLTLMNRSLAAICRDVWDSEFFVQLSSEKQLKRGETVPEIGLEVTSKAGSYLASSWGQRRMIDISVQLALRQLLLSCWPNRLPLLICDDVMDVLDQSAKYRLYQNLLFPESQRSAVFVLYADQGLPAHLAHRVVVGYNQDTGSYVRECELPGDCAAPVISFHATEEVLDA